MKGSDKNRFKRYSFLPRKKQILTLVIEISVVISLQDFFSVHVVLALLLRQEELDNVFIIHYVSYTEN